MSFVKNRWSAMKDKISVFLVETPDFFLQISLSKSVQAWELRDVGRSGRCITPFLSLDLVHNASRSSYLNPLFIFHGSLISCISLPLPQLKGTWLRPVSSHSASRRGWIGQRKNRQRGQHVQNRRLQIRKLNVENKCAIIYYCILKRTWPLRMIALSSAN